MQKKISLPDFFRQNTWFFSGFLLFVIIGGVLLFFIETGDAVFYFSGRRSYWVDLFYRYGTEMGEALVYIIALTVLLFVRYRYALVIPLLGFTVSVVAFGMKTFFGHDRPMLYFKKLGLFDQLTVIEGVRLNGGANSFPSGHTMSAFALYAFLAFCLPYKKGGSVVFFLLALMVGVSRIYLVQHFLKDIYLGAIVGVLIAMIWYYVSLLPRNQWMDGYMTLPINRKPLAGRE